MCVPYLGRVKNRMMHGANTQERTMGLDRPHHFQDSLVNEFLVVDVDIIQACVFAIWHYLQIGHGKQGMR